MDNVVDLVEKLKKKFEKSKKAYYPFIEYIRFPKYKLLQADSRINFDFPITLLVGKNGTNKTSILQALYGSPEGKSVGEYWFTTSVDKMDKDGVKNDDRHCLIYGYYFGKAKRIVIRTDVPVKANVLGSLFAISSFTGTLYLVDIPKSPDKTFLDHLTYCFKKLSFNPISSFFSSMYFVSPTVAIEVYFIDIGSDGAKYNIKKVRKVTPINIGIKYKILFIIYFIKVLSSFFIFICLLL